MIFFNLERLWYFVLLLRMGLPMMVLPSYVMPEVLLYVVMNSTNELIKPWLTVDKTAIFICYTDGDERCIKSPDNSQIDCLLLIYDPRQNNQHTAQPKHKIL